MNKYALALLMALSATLSGCNVQPIKLDEPPKATHTLRYSKILVEDFTQDKSVSVSDTVWVNGWTPMFDGTRGPSPNKTMHRYLSDAFLPGEGSNDTLRISLINSSYLMEKNFGDDMVFVNFIAGQRERGYKCTASLNISNSQKSERKEFEVAERRSGFVEIEWVREFTTRCRERLVESINTYLLSF